MKHACGLNLFPKLWLVPGGLGCFKTLLCYLLITHPTKLHVFTWNNGTNVLPCKQHKLPNWFFCQFYHFIKIILKQVLLSLVTSKHFLPPKSFYDQLVKKLSPSTKTRCPKWLTRVPKLLRLGWSSLQLAFQVPFTSRRDTVWSI